MGKDFVIRSFKKVSGVDATNIQTRLINQQKNEIVKNMGNYIAISTYRLANRMIKKYA